MADDELSILRGKVVAYRDLSLKCWGKHDPAADYKDLFQRLAVARLELFRLVRDAKAGEP
jgi:hypothetical protein